MTTVLTLLLVVLLVLVIAGVVGVAALGVWAGRPAVRVGRAATRSVRAGWSGARAALPSAAHEVRVQRARLDRELAVTSNAWDAGRRQLDRAARKRLAGTHEVLARTARQLGLELSVAAAEADPVRRQQWLPDLRLRVDAFVAACGSFRQGLLLAAGAYGDAHVARVADTAVALDLSVPFERVVDAEPVSLAKEPAGR